VKTLDEMLGRSLLSQEQHQAIAAWIRQARTPEAIQQMPEPLWRALALASLLMNVDADFMQAPLLQE
jgi:glutaredoxin 2